MCCLTVVKIYVVAVIKPRYQYRTKTICGCRVSPAVSFQLTRVLAAVESKYEKPYAQAKVNKRIRGQYARLRIRGTTVNTDTLCVIVRFCT